MVFFYGLHKITGTQVDIDVCRLKDAMAGNSGNLMDVESHTRKIGQAKMSDCMGCQFRQIASVVVPLMQILAKNSYVPKSVT